MPVCRYGPFNAEAEVYFMDDPPLSTDSGKLNKPIEERMAKADVVVVTDFGHGLQRKRSSC